MSIPTRIDVYCKRILIKANDSLGTISYGSNLNDRDVWLQYCRRLSDKTFDEIRKITHCPWILVFDEIKIKNYDFTFARWEVISKEQEERLKNAEQTLAARIDHQSGGPIQEGDSTE
jgi:hypothetical protein